MILIAIGVQVALRFPKITLALMLVTAISMWSSSAIAGRHGHWPAASGVPGPAPAGFPQLDGALADTVSPASWADTFLSALREPDTQANAQAIMAWERAEGGHWKNNAAFNPLNTTQREPGSWPINSVGVQAYANWDEGMTATLTTIGNGRYEGILAALSHGDCAPCVADAVAASPWGTGWFPT